MLVALLFSTVGQAKYLKAVLYLTDGTRKTGLAKVVEDDASKVAYKTDENADTEKIPSIALLRIVYTYESGNIVTMDYLYLTTASAFSGKFSNSRKKHWITMIYNKDFKIGKIYDKGDNSPKNFRAAKTSYFFGKKESDHLVFGFNTQGNMFKSYGTDATMKKMAKEEFLDCPTISIAIENEIFKLDTALSQIVAIFDKTVCK